MKKFSLHLCHPWSGDCAMRALRINLATPWAFVTIGLLGGEVHRRRADGTYGDKLTRLRIDHDWPRRRSSRSPQENRVDN